MELELKHLAAYLPYGLKLLNIQNDLIFELETDFLSYTIKNRELYKLVLRPLSDLTKEIELNGEKFVPILELYKLKTQSMDGEIYDFYIENNTVVLRFKGIQFEEIQFRQYFEVDLEPNEVMFSIATETWEDDKLKEENICQCGNEMLMFEKLKEWHFDIFGLIENGLAIGINALIF